MSLTLEQFIDVCALPARERHPTIMRNWNAMLRGQSILLEVDHDPLPLYYQFASENTGEFHWEYLQKGPELWRVRLRKGDFQHPGFMPEPKPKARTAPKPNAKPEPLVLDTRPLFQRGESPCSAIDDSVAALNPGQNFVLLVPFEPVPLYAKLGREGFDHKSTPMDDGTWKVEFFKPA